MSVRLNETAYDFAKELIAEGKAVYDERDDWSEHEPSAEEENRFIEEHGWREYAKQAAAHLHGMLEGIAAVSSPRCSPTPAPWRRTPLRSP